MRMAMCGKRKRKHLVFELICRNSVLRGFVIFDFFCGFMVSPKKTTMPWARVISKIPRFSIRICELLGFLVVVWLHCLDDIYVCLY